MTDHHQPLDELYAWGAMTQEQAQRDLNRMIAVDQQDILFRDAAQGRQGPTASPATTFSSKQQQYHGNEGLPLKSIKTEFFDSRRKWPVPLEICLQILHYLPFRSIIRCLRVNNTWRSVILRSPELWKHIDFEKDDVIPESLGSFYLQQYLDRGQRVVQRLRVQSVAMISSLCKTWQRVHHLDISHVSLHHLNIVQLQRMAWTMRLCVLDLEGSNVPVQTAILLACQIPPLQSLNIKDCFFTGEFISVDHITPQLAEAAQLTLRGNLEYTCSSRLTTLDLSGMRRSTIYALLWILYRCPRLQHIYAYDCGVTFQAFYRALLIYNPNLRSLYYSPGPDSTILSHIGWQHQYSNREEDPTVAMTHHHHIECIYLYNTHVHPDFTAFMIDTTYHTLRELHFVKSWFIHDQTLDHLAHRRPPRLEKLSLIRSTSFIDPDHLLVLQALPALQWLDLTGDRQAVTDTSVLRIVSEMRALTYLNVQHCKLLSRRTRVFLDDLCKAGRLHVDA